MLFLMGDSVEGVAAKTSYPLDVLIYTAAHYKWREKRDSFLEAGKHIDLVRDLEKSMLNNLLVATWQLINQEVGEVMAGKKALDACTFVPKSMTGVQKLLEMVDKINGMVAPAPEQPTQTVVHAQNVQINNHTPQTPEEKRREFLKQLSEQAEV
jgi:hypothetical protein